MMFSTSPKVAHISSDWVFQGSQEITTAAEGLQDIRSKIFSKEEPRIPMQCPQSFPFKKTSPMQKNCNNLFPSQGTFSKSLTFGAQLGVMASSGPFCCSGVWMLSFAQHF